MPPGEHSSSVEKFWLDPKPQFNDDTALNVLELYIIPHDAMSGANEMAAMAAEKELSVIGSADSNMASILGDRFEDEMHNAAKVLILKYQLGS
jgi:hypothetical protein